MKRVFLIVLDSVGIGASPDASLFGDEGTNTLKSAYGTGRLNIPNLISLGIGNIDGVDFLPKVNTPRASVGKMAELSMGKDTTTGHWELMGIVSSSPMPTYPDGFPDRIIREFEKRCQRGVLCNKPYSGTDVIRDFGKEHMETGKLIVYTSADSVFQIASHEDVVPLSELYRYCKIARELLVGEDSVGRVIARPFVGEVGSFVRTPNRHDFSLMPPKKTLLNAVCEKGLSVIGIGKINDIFSASGISESISTKSNDDGMKKTEKLLQRDFSGIAFLNLVDFDALYGHRQDPIGYAEALSRFDVWLGDFINGMQEGDALIITADHGCDTTDNDTDHTREYVPLIVYSRELTPKGLGTLKGFGTVAKIVGDMLEVDFTPDGYEAVDLR